MPPRLQSWFLAVYFTVVLVVGVLTFREWMLDREHAETDRQWDEFVCSLSEDC